MRCLRWCIDRETLLLPSQSAEKYRRCSPDVSLWELPVLMSRDCGVSGGVRFSPASCSALLQSI
eukprot:scaffold1668_cov171-Ochromonas_danica.AAC.1